jgi:4'-phosphopantetheinyl transferase
MPLDGLAAADTARAAAMVRVDDVVRVLASRHAVRFLLSRALACDARDLSIERDEFGKPYLVGQPGVHFNVSRSGTECVVGIGFSTPVGVDIEQLRDIDDATHLLSELCAPEELECCASEAHSDQFFMNAWTRKEACAKALGTGLRISPRLFATGCQTGVRNFDVELTGCISTLSVETFASPRSAVISVASAYGRRPAAHSHSCQ